MKVEWKVNDKNIYLPKSSPVKLIIPDYNYLSISGQGDPNGEDFGLAVEALYSISYSIKFLPKSGINPEGYYDYSVYPLEGDWDTREGETGFSADRKDKLIYTIMIRQPDFVTNDIVEAIKSKLIIKKKNLKINEVNLVNIKGGLCVQMMHTGSFDSEPLSFAVMNEFIKDNNLFRKTMSHREIYISDFNKTASDKLKTVLRYYCKG